MAVATTIRGLKTNLDLIDIVLGIVLPSHHIEGHVGWIFAEVGFVVKENVVVASTTSTVLVVTILEMTLAN